MKTWLITGASSGFGRMLAERASADGDAVIAVARRADKLAELARLPRTTTLELDITSEDAEPRIAAALATLPDGLDVLVNNAGYGVFGSAEEIPADVTRAVFATNFFGALAVARAALPKLRQARGRIIQVSSGLGQAVWPSSGVYSASKAAAEAAFEAIAIETAPAGVRVTIVEPGVFATEFAGAATMIPHGPLYEPTVGQFRKQVAAGGLAVGDPEDVVRAIRSLLDESDPPLRYAIGNDAVHYIRASLRARLAELESRHPTVE